MTFEKLFSSLVSRYMCILKLLIYCRFGCYEVLDSLCRPGYSSQHVSFIFVRKKKFLFLMLIILSSYRNFLPTYSSVLLVNGMVSALKALPGNIELAKKARLLNCLTENDKKVSF